MKKLNIIIFLLVAYISAWAQELWPIANEPIGSHILYTPGSYIGNEYNEYTMFIGGKKGSYILSPVNGKIISVFYQYLYSLTNSQIIGQDYFSKGKNVSSDINPQCVTLTIGIEMAPGDILYLSGMGKNRELKTGAKIKQGDTLGVLAYAYKKISVPSLLVGRSTNGISSDPMELLGLKTTFKKNNHKVNPLELKNPEELKADFIVFRQSLEEGHPGLYDYISRQRLDKMFDSTLQSIHNPLSVFDFEVLLISIVKSIRDKHTQFLTNYDMFKVREYSRQKMVSWPVRMGWEGNSLLITGATMTYNSLIGKTIKSINGINADTLKKRAEKYCLTEGFVRSSCDHYLITTWMSELHNFLNLQNERSIYIAFQDGTDITLKSFSKSISEKEAVLPSLKGFIKKWHRDILCNLINDSTAFIDLSTFDLNEVQIDTIFNFVRKITLKKIPNLVIDVRYNNGGSQETLSSIFSLFASEAFQMTQAEKVNSNSSYDFFKYTQNYKGVADLFGIYQKTNGKDGYWLSGNDIREYFPNDTIGYKGHIYILANEHCFSAASLFVSLMRKYHRGLVIGRETANPYHQMYGDKFAHVELPNSRIVLRIPLVKKVFDTIVNEEILFGRGVMPDYEIPLVRSELEFKSDPYVDKAMELIAGKVYVSSENITSKGIMKFKLRSFFLIAALGLIAIIFVFYFRYHWQNHKRIS